MSQYGLQKIYGTIRLLIELSSIKPIFWFLSDEISHTWVNVRNLIDSVDAAFITH